MAWDPDFIDFIDAYCDRWCERCPLTHKCAAFARQEDPEEIEDCSEAVEKAMDTLRQELAMPAASGRAWMDDLLAVPEPTEEEVREHQRNTRVRRARQREDQMMVSAREYAIEVHAWIRMYGDATRANVERARASLGEAAEAAVLRLETDAVVDALQVVSWDGVLIGGKIHRAIAGRDAAADGEGVDEDPVQTDFNGSAKLVLLLTERSEAAWRLIEQWAPEREVAAGFAKTLARLRHDVERRFPNALRFRRPGFDDPSS
jgi:hypothetical protein